MERTCTAGRAIAVGVILGLAAIWLVTRESDAVRAQQTGERAAGAAPLSISLEAGQPREPCARARAVR